MDILNDLPKLLVVSESSSSREKYKSFIRKAYGQCCKIIECAHGKEAIWLCMKDQPDCVIVDSVLADIHGIEFLELTKEIENFPQTQIILLLGDNTSIKLSELKPLGAQNYLFKQLLTPDRFCSVVVKSVKNNKRIKEEAQQLSSQAA